MNDLLGQRENDVLSLRAGLRLSGQVTTYTFAAMASRCMACNRQCVTLSTILDSDECIVLPSLQQNNLSCPVQPYARAPTTEALRAFLNLDLALECDGK